MRVDDTVVEVNLLAMPLIDMSKKHLGRRIAPFLNLFATDRRPFYTHTQTSPNLTACGALLSNKR